MLSDIGKKILDLKYARTLANGKKETWEQIVTRVANYISSVEPNKRQQELVMADFFKIIYECSFLPGGRILANAGTGILNLMNCFVIPVTDSRVGIYTALEKAAEVFAWGGGVGYNFSSLRGRGSPVITTGGEASGPLSFMELFDQTGEVISQASRRGAQMGILNIDHPDIRNFINYKNVLNTRNQRLYEEYLRNLEIAKLDRKGQKYFEIMRKTLADDQLTHFNISVAVTDIFMNAAFVNENSSSQDLLETIAENAWRNGDPGIYFIDRANIDNMVPYLGNLDATNPCGEVPLLPYEACCLGSINLKAFTNGRLVDWNYLRDVIRVAVRFLDNVQEMNVTAVPEINDATKATRRLGLGVMGLADVLEEAKFAYDSKEALAFVEQIAWFIGKESWIASMDLAEERGPFPAFNQDKVNWKLIEGYENLEKRPPRNVAITSIAPTGSIALLAGVNSGIEPYFSKKYKRNITEGVGNIAKDSIDTSVIANYSRTAHEIHWHDHIAMQALWQIYTDNAVSKTINMSNNVSIDEVLQAYWEAWASGLKGITIYRDGSKLFQILNAEDGNGK